MARYVGVIFHILISLCVLVGVYDVMKNYFEHCECEMSYMYELPQYKKVPLSDDTTSQFPRYDLYLYGEGQHFNAVSDLNLHGIPVLYLPGNMGSMKQCRSVASILLRKAETKQWKPHFNVFTIDFNEEYTALYGPFLHRQIQFVKHSIKAILKLYEDNDASKNPKSVVVVAHSMGGIVARGVFMLPDFDSSAINSIYSLATPHLHPVISLDTEMAAMFDKINSYWEENTSILNHVTFVSVSGGSRDFQVNGAVATAPLSNTSLNVQSTMIPRAWISADHQCAVWCKQVVKVVTRSLFDMVDSNTGQISEDKDYRLKVARHHFISNSGLDPSKWGKESRIKLINTYQVNHINAMQWTSATRSAEDASAYYFVDLHAAIKEGKSHVIIRTTLVINKWILGCESPNCKSAVDLSELGYLTPEYKVAELDAAELIAREISHILLKVPKLSKHIGSVDMNIISKNDDLINVSVPHIFSNLWTLNQGYTVNNTLGHVKGVYYHNLALVGLQSIYHAYIISIKPIHSSGKSKNVMMALKLPSHDVMTYSNTSEMSVKLISTSGTEDPTVFVYTDGVSAYSITIRPDFVGILGQIIRYEWPILPSMITFNILLAFSYQLKVVVSGGTCQSTKEAHGISAKPYKLQPFINLVKALYAYEWFSSAWQTVGLPIPDANRLDDDYRIWFAFLPLVMFLYAAEIFSAVLLFVSHLVSVGAILCRKFVKSPTHADYEPKFLTSVLHAAITAGLLTVSSGLALWYIAAVNYIDLCVLAAKSKMTIDSSDSSDKKATDGAVRTFGHEDSHSDSHEPNTTKDQQSEESLLSAYNIKLTLQLIWIVLAIISLPSMFSWIKGLQSPNEDIWQSVAGVGALLFVLHRQQPVVPVPSTFHKLMSKILYPMIVISSIVCLHSLHRLPYFLVAVLSVYVAMQHFG